MNMKNLNEQIERINSISNYQVGVTITEQEKSVKSNEITGGLTFLITAGASNKPMRTEALHNEQGFPLPKDSTSMDVHLYEVRLSDALNDDFSKSIILGKVNEKNKDQIIFEGESLINKGVIRIPINQETINKTIKVSGNGGLVLSRAANEYKLIKKLGGLMILELSANKLYSNHTSIESLGITQSNLIAKTNSTLNGLIYQLNNDSGKSELDSRLINYEEYPDKYWVSIKDLNDKIVPINIKWSDKISLFKNTVDQNNYKTKYNIISKVVKDEIISPGLEQLSSTVSKFLGENLPTIPNDIINQFVTSLNKIIKSTNNQLTVDYIKNYFETNSYSKKETNPVRKTPKPEIKTSDTKYKEGQG